MINKTGSVPISLPSSDEVMALAAGCFETVLIEHDANVQQLLEEGPYFVINNTSNTLNACYYCFMIRDI